MNQKELDNFIRAREDICKRTAKAVEELGGDFSRMINNGLNLSLTLLYDQYSRPGIPESFVNFFQNIFRREVDIERVRFIFNLQRAGVEKQAHTINVWVLGNNPDVRSDLEEMNKYRVVDPRSEVVYPLEVLLALSQTPFGCVYKQCALKSFTSAVENRLYYDPIRRDVSPKVVLALGEMVYDSDEGVESVNLFDRLLNPPRELIRMGRAGFLRKFSPTPLPAVTRPERVLKIWTLGVEESETPPYLK